MMENKLFRENYGNINLKMNQITKIVMPSVAYCQTFICSSRNYWFTRWSYADPME
jgi:hypothetical protein